MIAAFFNVLNTIDSGDIDRRPMRAEQPPKGSVFVGLPPHVGGGLVTSNRATIPKLTGQVSAHDLQRPGGFFGSLNLEPLGINLDEFRARRRRGEHRIICRQHTRAAFFLRKDQRLRAAHQCWC